MLLLPPYSRALFKIKVRLTESLRVVSLSISFFCMMHQIQIQHQTRPSFDSTGFSSSDTKLYQIFNKGDKLCGQNALSYIGSQRGCFQNNASVRNRLIDSRLHLSKQQYMKLFDLIGGVIPEVQNMVWNVVLEYIKRLSCHNFLLVELPQSLLFQSLF